MLLLLFPNRFVVLLVIGAVVADDETELPGAPPGVEAADALNEKPPDPAGAALFPPKPGVCPAVGGGCDVDVDGGAVVGLLLPNGFPVGAGAGPLLLLFPVPNANTIVIGNKKTGF